MSAIPNPDHTQEVRGSSPLAPTILRSKRFVGCFELRMASHRLFTRNGMLSEAQESEASLPAGNPGERRYLGQVNATWILRSVSQTASVFSFGETMAKRQLRFPASAVRPQISR